MAYNPSLYNPYGFQQPYTQQQFQPSTNGLIAMDSIEGVHMYPMGPNSVSPPLFLRNEPVFFIKSTDGGGAATIRKFPFKEEPLTDNKNSEFVTREYFDQQMNNILEAINGKSSIPTEQQTTEQQQSTVQYAQPDQGNGAI